MQKIKPCPFCGSKAKWVEVSDTMGDLLIKGYKLECSKCWCSPYPNNYTGNKEDAIVVWNTRHISGKENHD